MLYRKVKFKGKKLTFTIPEGWHEITLRQAIDLASAKTYLDKLWVLCGVPVDILQDADFFNVYQFIDNNTQWSHQPVTEDDIEPIELIDIDQRLTKVPTSLRATSIGQYEDMKVIVGRHQGKEDTTTADYYRLLAAMSAIYLYPEYTGEKYDYEKADKFATDVLPGCKFTEILSIGYFFLSSLIASRNGMAKTAHPQAFQIKKLVQDIKGFLRRGVSTPTYILWQMVIS